jgi:ribonuclease Z
MPSQAGAAVGDRNAIGTQAGSYEGARGCASASRAARGSDAAGGGCLWTVSACEVRAIDSLCFSHLHIDHVAGFDSFLRLNFARPGAPVPIDWPELTTRAIHHRLRGVSWRLIAGQPGRFRVTDILQEKMVTSGS